MQVVASGRIFLGLVEGDRFSILLKNKKQMIFKKVLSWRAQNFGINGRRNE